jgi:hypothetical protein
MCSELLEDISYAAVRRVAKDKDASIEIAANEGKSL